MKRGDVVTIAIQGDYGKPRPAVVIQSNELRGGESVLVVPFTSTIRDTPFYRLTVEPSGANGLRAVSQIMVDKIAPCPVAKCGEVIGHIDSRTMFQLGNMLSVLIGLAD